MRSAESRLLRPDESGHCEPLSIIRDPRQNGRPPRRETRDSERTTMSSEQRYDSRLAGRRSVAEAGNSSSGACQISLSEMRGKMAKANATSPPVAGLPPRAEAPAGGFA